MDQRIIDALVEPTDLHVLNNEELALVAQEIRDQIIATTSQTGGHVASSLGAVEAIVALHAELNCPHDKIVYDVGHQAYAHKMLTGRLPRFDSLRTHGGLSGFPNPGESSYDVHYSGHASDSLSVALGLVKARDLRGTDERVVAVIGDASISGGMAFEALNQIGLEHARMVIVLNDNEMSISSNVGALARHFGELRASSEYQESRAFLREQLDRRGQLSQAAHAALHSMKSSAKHFFLPDRSMVYEQLGITCMAPVDGHDIAALRRALRSALNSYGPTLVHVVTKKGAGYPPAENAPERFHLVGAFDPATGEAAEQAADTRYMDVFGEAAVREARADGHVVAITAAMEAGTGLSAFAREFPSRFVDVGISEEHAVGLAGGLALGGDKPLVAIYSTFLQRALDQIIVDVALPRLDVVFCVDRAGLVGADGQTHNGMFDLVYMRMIPNMRVLAPSCARELTDALHTALALGGPFAIRYPRGACADPVPEGEPCVLPEGVSRLVREGDDVAILAFGSMVRPALGAAKLLAAEGVQARVVDMRWVKPLDRAAIRAAAGTKLVVTVEEGVLAGGVGEGVARVLSSEGLCVPTLHLGIPDTFVMQGTVAELHRELGLDADGIAASVRARL